MYKFGPKDKKIEIITPISGTIMDLQGVPDPVFAEKMIGEGVAIIPSEGRVVSPVNGEIVQLFPTKHAIGILTDSGLEVLIHVGLDTVELKGEGFNAYVAQGDRVCVGQELIDFDLPFIKEKATSSVVPVIFTNADIIEEFFITEERAVTAGKNVLMETILKK